MQQSLQLSASVIRAHAGLRSDLRCASSRSAFRAPDQHLAFRQRSQAQQIGSRSARSVCVSAAAPQLVDGPNGQQKVVLKSSDGGSAEVFLQGAHVTSWKSSKGEEVFFLSKKAIFAPPKPIRGGIPLCFPQFGPMGKIQAHGFARNSVFELAEGSDDSVTMSLTPTTDLHRTYPHDFHCRVTVKLGSDSLTQTLEVENKSSEPMPVGMAFHTYFDVSDIDNVYVDLGSEGPTYLDGTKGKAETKLSGSRVKLQEEWDAIFVGAADTLKLVDEKTGRAITIKKEGLPDAVVWNPWAEKEAGFADMAEGESRKFVCVEPALAASGPVQVQPGQKWSCTQVLSVSS